MKYLLIIALALLVGGCESPCMLERIHRLEYKVWYDDLAIQAIQQKTGILPSVSLNDPPPQDHGEPVPHDRIP